MIDYAKQSNNCQYIRANVINFETIRTQKNNQSLQVTHIETDHSNPMLQKISCDMVIMAAGIVFFKFKKKKRLQCCNEYEL